METECPAKSPKRNMQPRSYQLKLVDYLQERNGIVYLPTGSGKTFIAIMALKRFSHQLQNTIQNGGKRAIFMCNTVELSRQQASEVREYTQLNVGLYVGERNPDDWTKEQWSLEIEENQVLVGTAQIFLNIICQGLLKVTDLSIVIIDECHHGTKNHPMHAFMCLCQKVENKELLPRIVGLTGVLIKGNKLNNIEEQLESLETAFRGNIITVNSDDEYQNVMLYSTKPKEEMASYPDRTVELKIEDNIKQMVYRCKTLVDRCHIGDVPVRQSKNLCSIREPSKKNFAKNLLEDFLHQMQHFGLYTASFAIMSVLIEFELKRRAAETIALRKMYRTLITECDSIRHTIMHEFQNDENGPNKQCHSLNVMNNYSSPKLRALFLYMKKKFIGKGKKDIRCLLFVERRYTAKCVYFVLNQFVEQTPELKETLKLDFMVGRNNIPNSIEAVLDKKWDKKAIKDFRKGVCNMLVCSNVLEEGIDVQSCNYVFVLDKLKTFNSYVQTKGRARSENALYTLFVPKSTEGKVIQQITDYNRAHLAIQQYLRHRVLDNDDPEEHVIDKHFEEKIPPIMLPNGASILAVNALGLLHRYCQQLPMDAFGDAKPWFLKENLPKGIRVGVQMPIQSTVKETIYGDVFSTVRTAKISAAVKVCQKLYERGELNDRLQPITQTECVASVSESLFDHWHKFNDDVTFNDAGRKKKRLYNHKYPEELYNAVPRIGEECYAYEIETMPKFDVTDHSQHIDELLKSKGNYAILTRKKLPALAEMPLYLNQGKISVKISNKPLVMAIRNSEEMDQLLKYHLMIFRDIVVNWKTFFVLDGRNLENAYVIVPLKDGQLNWDLVKSFPRISPQRGYSTTERENKVYNPEDFLGKIINKWYSGIDHQRFVVTKVLTNLTPMSRFDNDSFESYVHFTESRYKAEVERIVQTNTFMLEVRELTHRRNFFINAVGKSATKAHRNSAIRLIPELCYNFMYPGDMWLKALLLPSILHRVHYMLHAETLRIRINSFLNIKSDAYEPLPIEVDESLSRAVDIDGNAMEEHVDQKKLLPNLPTRETEKVSVDTVLSDEASWKEFLEPTDVSNALSAIYPIELDYYHKFISGLIKAESILKTEKTAKGEYKSTQTNMAEVKVFGNGLSLDAFAITDVPLDDKRRIEIVEHTLKANKLQTAEQREFLAAITTAGAADVFDMERFEFLGDSFLKFSVSLYLANCYPNWHEGFLTVVKSKVVSNRNLLYCMLNTDIPDRICAHLFKPPHEWLPPLISLPSNLLEVLQNDTNILDRISPIDLYSMDLTEDEVYSGKCTDEHINSVITSSNRNMAVHSSTEKYSTDNDLNLFVYKSSLRDKVIADTMEALLGVCVKNYGIFETFRMLEFFGICKPEKNQSLTHLLDLRLGSPLLHANISSKEVDSFLINYQKLEKNLNYKFRDRAYLLQALTHPSYPTNRITGCYQELEFIGDAILDFLVSCYIFERHKSMTPGKLTDLRTALVNNITLGCVCVRHRFHLFMLAENAVLAEAIKNFAAYQEKHQHRVNDQVNILMEEDVLLTGAENVGSYNLAANVDVPKALGDIVEALIAAVYLDSRDLRITWNVIYHLLEQEFTQFAREVPMDAVRQLYSHKYANPKFSPPVTDNDVVMVKCVFTCLEKSMEVNGFSGNKLQAKKAAAKHALKILTTR